MRRVSGAELSGRKPFFDAAVQVAKRATCHRAHCGTVIVKDGRVIGAGYNSPPLDAPEQRTCDASWDYDKKPKYDKTCCVHAEWRAILDACKGAGKAVEGSCLYFARIDEQGAITDAGVPYCTVCSRLALDAGIAEFALWNKGVADIYDCAEYNQASYNYYALMKKPERL